MYISPYRRIANMRRMFNEPYAETAKREREMRLAIDVQADDDTYILKALVPGLDADDLNLEILDNTVTIRGEFLSNGDENEDVNYLMSELPAGKFSRSIKLPTEIEAAKAEAMIKNGMLTLSVPKAEEHRPKSIKVKVE
jgi:HSP20 family protein